MFGFVINGLIPYINGEITQVYYLVKPFINVLVGIICSVFFEAIYIKTAGAARESCPLFGTPLVL